MSGPKSETLAAAVERVKQFADMLNATTEIALRNPDREGASSRVAHNQQLAAAINCTLTALEEAERDRDAEADKPWPAWALRIHDKLQEYGAEPDDVDGTCDLAEAFDAWVDDYAVDCEARATAAEAESARLKAELQAVHRWAVEEKIPLRPQEIASIDAALKGGSDV